MMKYFKFLVWGALVGMLILLGGTYWFGTQLTTRSTANIGIPPSFLPAETVHFLNTNGQRLAGWYVPGQPNCGAVILMHATRFNRLSMVERARFLHKAGYSVLLFDFQAHGESEGDLVTFGDRERDDARTAVKFMSQRHPSASIGMIGFSLGGTAAVLNGSSLGADALIIEAVLSTLEQAVINRIHQRVGPLAPLLAHPLLLSFQLRYGINPTSIHPIDSIGTLGIPVFVIGGTHDQHTLPSETQALYSTAHSPKELWLVQGAHHQDFHQYAPTEYETRVLAFLNTHMGCTPSSTRQ